MIPAKEAKDMLYTLLSQNLVQLQVRARHVKMLIHVFLTKLLHNTELINSNLANMRQGDGL